MRATELLRNKFGVSQLYKHEVKDGDDVVLEVYWHPLTIAERESIQKKTGQSKLSSCYTVLGNSRDELLYHELIFI